MPPMTTFGFLLATVFFGCLSYDAYQFRHSANYRVWAVPSPIMRKGGDPLSLREQERLQTNKLTAIGGIPGLHWVFGILAVGSAACSLWSVLR